VLTSFHGSTIRYGWHAAVSGYGVFSALRGLRFWSLSTAKPSDHPTLTGAELRHIYEEAAEQMGPSTPWLKLLTVQADLGFRDRKVPTDPFGGFIFSGCRILQ